jgi:photosystem II stability/assembly factor-like uncharacterized protein
VARLVGLAAAVAVVLALGANAATQRETREITKAQLLSPGFGYVVVRQNTRSPRYLEFDRLLVWNGTRWRNATPHLGKDVIIDDATFLDSRHGWLAAYNFDTIELDLYRTSSGGRTWARFRNVNSHSANGLTEVTFVDDSVGWMAVTEPTGPGEGLWRTVDGGRTWSKVRDFLDFPCLGDVRFDNTVDGWFARKLYFSNTNLCFYRTTDGGRHWHLSPFTMPTGWSKADVEVDLPTRFGHVWLLPVNLQLGRKAAVAIFESTDAGHWHLLALRHVRRCATGEYGRYAPVAIVRPGLWWIAQNDGRLASTTDGGHEWRFRALSGLPSRACSVDGLTAVDGRLAWLTASSRLYETLDGGRTWRPVIFPLR